MEKPQSAIDSSLIWNDLVAWVQKEGGSIHDSLELKGLGPSRGVFAKESISKGETLIRLPPSCVLSSQNISGVPSERPASPWLKCLAAFYQANGSNDKFWEPYLQSLPEEYETLFQWTDNQVRDFLAGTTLGDMIQADRQDDSMNKRYKLAVRPYLQSLGLLPSNGGGDIGNEMTPFLRACMTISTRGFHMRGTKAANLANDTVAGDNNDDASSDDTNNHGPFLLPIIDLLNHDPPVKCTTLQRDAETGFFFMEAERSITKGEEIYHSYGDTLTAAQTLQTFGFVPTRTTTDSIPNPTTPVRLDKNSHLLPACQDVKQSKTVREALQSLNTEDSWDISSLPDLTFPDSPQIPEDWLIQADGQEIVSDELITFLVIQFLPDDTLSEFVATLNDGKQEIIAWLDKSILDTVPFLKHIVGETLIRAVQRKLNDFNSWNLPPQLPGTRSVNGLETEQRLLATLQNDIKTRDIMATNDSHLAIQEMRAVCGLDVRIEELSCLKALYAQARQWAPDVDSTPSSPKRAKLGLATAE
eukprot:Nitzschia sp. Nitz4//scaffold89_size161592//46758//48344//NITZ4_002369-RA/size161592-processed-gene-0.38-mRNA-1//-1//CDS//3329559589//5060//frame0